MTKTMELGEKGRLHGNIATQKEIRLTDARTGKALGSAITGAEVGDMLVVGGAARRVVGVTAGGVSLASVSGGGGDALSAPGFARRRSGGAFRWLLPKSLRG
jgi:hypothetical protein